jgi:tripartite-type tricarboxylate transporter receptor subunit TctC
MRGAALVAFACLASAALNGALAQDYPNRPIRYVIPFPPGGATDANGRALAREVEAILGQPLVIDNRGGANGIIAGELVAKAAPDGYTVLYTSVAFAINPSTHRKLPFDVIRDFTPVTNPIVGQGSLLAVNPSLPAKSVKELIALAKERQLTFGSPGVGNVLHLIGTAFNTRAGIDMLHVPYKGAGPALTAIIAGEVQVMVVPVLIALPHLKTGRLRPLGYSGAKRLDAIPNVPTISEAGLPGFQMDTGWHAVFAPAKLPDKVAVRLHAAIHKAVQTPKLRDYFLAAGYQPTADAPALFQKNFRDDVKRWGELVQLAKIVPE